MASRSFREEFANLINAGFPYIYIPTYEENRVQDQILDIVYRSGLIKTERNVYIWTQTEGLIKIPADDQGRQAVHDTKDPVKALEYIEKGEDPGLFIMKDMHIFFGSQRGTHPDFVLVRKFRDVIKSLQMNRKNVVFISPTLTIPSDMEKDMSVLDFDLPDEEELLYLLDDLCGGLSQDQISVDEAGRRRLVRAALGLTMREAENAFCRAIVSGKGLGPEALGVIYEEKNQVVKKTGMLEFIKTDLGADDIGGLENLKNWLIKRNNTWTERARAYGLPSPKGVLITGVPGCGKSLTAKAMSAIWSLPLLKLDMGRIFGGIVGSSEENMRRAISTAEAIAPSILWIDEIEKGLSGVRSGGDSGTSARVFGTFLTWLQEKSKPVFVIATANDISSLPPELLRKGRFDEIFFVDLPTLKERQKIFKVHVEKQISAGSIEHDIPTDDDTMLRLAGLTDGFTGSEIEQVVISAMYEAFYKDRGMTEQDIEKAVKETVPVSVTQKEQILALREWAAERAVLATAAGDQEYEHPAGGSESGRAAGGNRQGGRLVSFDL